MDLSDVIRSRRRRIREQRAVVQGLRDDLEIAELTLNTETSDLAVLERIAQSEGVVVLDDQLDNRDPTWLEKERTTAVADVLDLADRPLTPKEIAEILNGYGRTDNYEHVSATLAHLKRSDPPRAYLVGRAQWVSRQSPLASLTQVERDSMLIDAEIVRQLGESP